jgi:hypothetical protein
MVNTGLQATEQNKRSSDICFVLLLLLLHADGVRLSLNCDHCSSYRYMNMEARWNDTDRENTKRTRRKNCPSATLCATNPTWTDPGANPGLRGERSATKRLSHGTACFVHQVLCSETGTLNTSWRYAADSQRSQCVAIATTWKRRNRGKKKYMVSFLIVVSRMWGTSVRLNTTVTFSHWHYPKKPKPTSWYFCFILASLDVAIAFHRTLVAATES